MMSILIGLLLVLSVFATAETDTGANVDETEQPEAVLLANEDTAEEETTASTEEVDEEDEGETEDEEDDIEEIEEEYEESETGDEIIDEIEDEEETDGEIEEELEINEEESAEIREAIENIGLRQYILNRQLKQRVFVATIHGEAIILYLQGKEYDTTELEGINDELKEIYKAIDPKTMTKEEFNETVGEVKELVQEFKDAVDELVPEEEKDAIRNRIAAYVRTHQKQIDLLLKKEWKARMLNNRKQLRDSLKAVKEDAKQLRMDGRKLLDAAKRLRNLKAIKNRYKNGTIDATEIKQKWQEETKLYGLARAASVVKNERALLAIGAARIRKAIKEADEDDEDTTELENRLAEINAQIKDFIPGKVTSKEAGAKAAVIKSRLVNLEKNERLTNRIQAARANVAPRAAAKQIQNARVSSAIARRGAAASANTGASEGDEE